MSDHILVATRKGLFGVERKRRKWRLGEPWFLGDPVTAVLPDARDGSIYAALNLGHFGVKLRRSRDRAKTWHEHPAPSYPPQPEGDPVEAGGVPWKLEQVWSLEAGGSDEPGVIWAGTIPGGLFRSTDGGDSWALVHALWTRPERKEWAGGGYDHPGIHSICVDPRDSRRVTVAVSTGGVWATEDAGESWSCRASGMRAEYMPPERAGDPNVQDVHCMVQCRAKPAALWVQHHNGIFRSTDYCASWQEITGVKPSAFGFAVAVHPDEPDTAWFVPAVKDERRVPVDGTFAVTRTRDGGKTFEVLTQGLPPQRAYDLVYRHGLDVDASGDRLVMGSTTGGLWISENQGDTWVCIRERLPPINCVRFVH
jgi:photosystem II stability/assembly factor-like uncharacterized protein